MVIINILISIFACIGIGVIWFFCMVKWCHNEIGALTTNEIILSLGNGYLAILLMIVSILVIWK